MCVIFRIFYAEGPQDENPAGLSGYFHFASPFYVCLDSLPCPIVRSCHASSPSCSTVRNVFFGHASQGCSNHSKWHSTLYMSAGYDRTEKPMLKILSFMALSLEVWKEDCLYLPEANSDWWSDEVKRDTGTNRVGLDER